MHKHRNIRWTQAISRRTASLSLGHGTGSDGGGDVGGDAVETVDRLIAALAVHLHSEQDAVAGGVRNDLCAQASAWVRVFVCACVIEYLDSVTVLYLCPCLCPVCVCLCLLCDGGVRATRMRT